MSLATQCTACETVFRVTQEQLEASQGWVRCGGCQEQFNALDGLFDLQPDVAAAEDAAAASIEPGPLPEAVSMPSSVSSNALVNETLDGEPVQEQTEQNYTDFLGPKPSLRLSDDAGDQAGNVTQEYLSAETDENVASMPSFARQPNDPARGNRLGPRIFLSLLALLLTVALVLQYSIHFRNPLVQLLPQARPTLDMLCKYALCSIEPYQRIDDVVVESSALTRAPSGKVSRLMVVLRNRGDFSLAMPSIDLTLTDSGGQILARRSLIPNDYLHSSDVLRSGQESTALVVLAGVSTRTTGYTVEAFYP